MASNKDEAQTLDVAEHTVQLFSKWLRRVFEYFFPELPSGLNRVHQSNTRFQPNDATQPLGIGQRVESGAWLIRRNRKFPARNSS